MCGDFEQKQHGILFCLRHSFLTSRFYEGKTSEMLPSKHEDRALASKGTSDYNFYVKTKSFFSSPSVEAVATCKNLGFAQCPNSALTVPGTKIRSARRF